MRFGGFVPPQHKKKKKETTKGFSDSPQDAHFKRTWRQYLEKTPTSSSRWPQKLEIYSVT